jgi:hypothetical protein
MRFSSNKEVLSELIACRDYALSFYSDRDLPTDAEASEWKDRYCRVLTHIACGLCQPTIAPTDLELRQYENAATHALALFDRTDELWIALMVSSVDLDYLVMKLARLEGAKTDARSRVVLSGFGVVTRLADYKRKLFASLDAKYEAWAA